jgi:hypothetical protein
VFRGDSFKPSAFLIDDKNERELQMGDPLRKKNKEMSQEAPRNLEKTPKNLE